MVEKIIGKSALVMSLVLSLCGTIFVPHHVAFICCLLLIFSEDTLIGTYGFLIMKKNLNKYQPWLSAHGIMILNKCQTS